MTAIGIDRLLSNYGELLSGKKIALITNNAARSKDLRSTLEVVKTVVRGENITVLTPEHGYYGDYQAGASVSSSFDYNHQVQFESLYQDMDAKLKSDDIDESMRTKDSQKDSSKYPSVEILSKFDAVVYDLQDVGCRIYTYIATMVYTLEVASGLPLDFIVLDRPNPISGLAPEGPVLKDNLHSFIGALPITMRHSLTIGELALFYNRFMNSERARLKIIEMDGWNRAMWQDQIGYHWIMPSPNIPTLDTAAVYPGNVLFEGTNVSEGRGTTRPFQIIGAPWLDGYRLKERVNGLNLPGAKLVEMKFRPTFSKFSGEVCNGVYVIITDRNNYRPFDFALNLLSEIVEMNPDEFQFHKDYFDKAAGDSKVREMLTQGYSGSDITEKFSGEVQIFEEKIREIKIYK